MVLCPSVASVQTNCACAVEVEREVIRVGGDQAARKRWRPQTLLGDLAQTSCRFHKVSATFEVNWREQ